MNSPDITHDELLLLIEFGDWNYAASYLKTRKTPLKICKLFKSLYVISLQCRSCNNHRIFILKCNLTVQYSNYARYRIECTYYSKIPKVLLCFTNNFLVKYYTTKKILRSKLIPILTDQNWTDLWHSDWKTAFRILSSPQQAFSPQVTQAVG
jgi:hypothetical protein